MQGSAVLVRAHNDTMVGPQKPGQLARWGGPDAGQVQGDGPHHCTAYIFSSVFIDFLVRTRSSQCTHPSTSCSSLSPSCARGECMLFSQLAQVTLTVCFSRRPLRASSAKRSKIGSIYYTEFYLRRPIHLKRRRLCSDRPVPTWHFPPFLLRLNRCHRHRPRCPPRR